MTTTSDQKAQIVEINGFTIAFVESIQSDISKLRYKVREGGGSWSSFVDLTYPSEIRGNGVALVTVPVEDTGLKQVESDKWQVLVDDGGLILLRALPAGSSWQLVGNRYLLVPAPESKNASAPTMCLTPAPEARFSRSGIREVPDDDFDRPSYRRPDNTPFIEPTIAFSLVRPGNGCFTAVLTPTKEPSRTRWVFFTTTGGNNPSFVVQSFPRGEQGWPYEQKDTGKENTIQLVQAETEPLTVLTPIGQPSSTQFRRQEFVDGGDTSVTRARLMLASKVDPDGRMICIDFALDDTGHPIVEDNGSGQLPLHPVNSARSSLRFNGNKDVVLIPDTVPATDGDFTVECWVRNVSGNGIIIQRDAASTQPREAQGGAPLVMKWDADNEQIVLTLNLLDGNNQPISAEAKTPAPSLGDWHHLAASWAKVPENNYQIQFFVDGVKTTLTPINPESTAKLAPQGAIKVGGDGNTLGLNGGVSELRWWSIALDETIIDRFLYRELPDPKGRISLVGYWPMGNPGSAPDEVTDESSHGNTGTVSGADWVTDTAPIDSGDVAFGLSSGMGIQTFLDGATDPQLTISADGLVHLYACSSGKKLFAAHYDTRTKRAHYTTKMPGAIVLAAHHPGPAMNRGPLNDKGIMEPVVEIVDNKVKDFVDVTLRSPAVIGLNETFTAVPAAVPAFRQVLNGLASPDPLATVVKTGQRVFYDYDGTRPTVRIPTNEDDLLLVTARSDRYPSGLALESTSVLDTGQVAIKFSSVSTKVKVGSIETIVTRNLLPTLEVNDVGASTSALINALRGISGSAPNKSGVTMLDLETSKSPVQFVTGSNTVLGVSIKVDLEAETVLVTTKITGNDPVTVEWPGVPSAAVDFIATLNGMNQKYSYTTDQVNVMKSFVAIGANNGPFKTETAVATTQVSVSAFLNMIVPGPTAVLNKGTFQAGPKQGKTTDPKADSGEGNGSVLLQVLPSRPPSDGTTASVTAGTGKLTQFGNFGGWIPAPPVTAGDFSNSTASKTSIADTAPLGSVGDFTVEGWLCPHDTSEANEAQRLLSSRGSDAMTMGVDVTSNIATEISNISSLTSESSVGTTISMLWSPGKITEDGPVPVASININLSNDTTVNPVIPANCVLARTMTNFYVYLYTPYYPDYGQFDILQFPPAAVPTAGWQYLVFTFDSETGVFGLRSFPLVGDGPQFNQGVFHGSFKDPNRIKPLGFTIGRPQFNTLYPLLVTDSYANISIWKKSIDDVVAMDLRKSTPRLSSPNLVGYFDLSSMNGSQAPNLSTGVAGPLMANDMSNIKPGVLGPYTRHQPFIGVGDRLLVATEDMEANKWNHVAGVATDTVAVSFDGQAGAIVKDSKDLDFGTEMGIDAWVVLLDKDPGSIYPQAIIAKSNKVTEEFSYELSFLPDGGLVFKVNLDDGSEHKFVSVTPVPRGVPVYVGAACKVTQDTEQPRGNFNYSYNEKGAGADKNGSGNITSTTTYRTFLHARLGFYVQGEENVTMPEIAPVLLYSGTKVKNILLNETSTQVSIAQDTSATAGARGTFKGTIAEMRLWSLDISPHFNDLAKSDALPDQLASGLEANWTFDTGSGKVLKDAAGSHDATLPASASWVPSAATTRLRLFLNGQPALGNIYPIGRLNNALGKINTITLGGVTLDKDSVVDRFNGLADEIRVWSVARTPNEITRNRFVEVDAADPNLAAYWPVTTGSGTTIRDVTGHGMDLILTNPEAPFWWKPDHENESPVGIEAPVFTNAVGGPRTSFQVKDAVSAASTVEHGVMALSSNGRKQAFMNRQSVYIREIAGVRTAVFTEDFPVGDLDLTYIGQAQTDPTLIGYIEGAPPVPCENLTTPYWTGPNRYQAYDGVTSVAIKDGQEVNYTYESGRDRGDDHAVSVVTGLVAKAGLDANFEPFGFGITSNILEYDANLGVGTDVTWRNGHVQAIGSGASRQKEATSEIAAGGDWEPREEGSERRYIPDNVGFALVRSSVANIFALQLRRTNTLVGLVTVPDPKIKPDENVINFPINPFYTKQGTLDGRIGFEQDKDFPQAKSGRGSYFRPQEAADLEAQIEAAEADAESYYKALAVGSPPEEAVFEPDNENQKSPADNWTDNLVNSYVWTADGGLYTESQQGTHQRSESSGGSFNSTNLSIFQGSLSVATAFGGVYVDGQGMHGTHLDTTISKAKEESASIALEVTDECESFLVRWELKDNEWVPSSAESGKVNAYRFKTFYLSANEKWFDQFFSEVIDQNWLMTSDAPDAIALRSAKSRRNRLWRVLHRVTYVSRVPPNIDRVPAETESHPEMAVIDVPQNIQLINDVAKAMVGLEGPLRVRVATALNNVFKDGLNQSLPWWPAINASNPGSVAQVKAAALEYLTSYFASLFARVSEIGHPS